MPEPTLRSDYPPIVHRRPTPIALYAARSREGTPQFAALLNAELRACMADLEALAGVQRIACAARLEDAASVLAELAPLVALQHRMTARTGA